MTTTPIPLAHLHLAWPELWPMLERAAKRSPDFSRAQPGERPDVLADLLAKRTQLWAIVEHDKPIAAVITKIQDEPERRCLLWLVGACPEASRRGSRVREWAPDFLAVVERWARDAGCVALWGTGRKGWARIVPLFGGERIEDHDSMPAWQRRL